MKIKTNFKLYKNVPMNKFCDPVDIAEAIKFILNSRNNITTGSNIVIDGGEIL